MQHPKKKSNWSNLGSVILNTLNILRNKYLPSITVYDTNKRSRGLGLHSSCLYSNVPRMGVKGRETQVPLRVTRQVMALESQGQKWLIYSWETWPNSATLSDNYRKSPKEQKHERHALFSKTFSRWRVRGSSESSFDHHEWTCSITWARNPGYWEFETLKTVSCQISKLGVCVDINDKKQFRRTSLLRESALRTRAYSFNCLHVFLGPLDTVFTSF